MNNSITVEFSEIAQNISTHVDPKTTDLNIYVGLEHLDSDSLHIKRKGTPTDVDGEKLLVRKGDIIFGKRRAYQRKVGIADFDGICSAHAMVLRPIEDTIIKELFPFFMQSDQFMNRALQISVGSLSPTINWKTLVKQEFTIPVKGEQKKIASLLWEAENCIMKNERFIEEAERAKNVLIRELFSKGIGHTKFKNTEIGKIPEEWTVQPLNIVCDRITDGSHYSPKNVEISEYKIATIVNIHHSKFDLNSCKNITKDEYEKLVKNGCKPNLNDILFSKDGTVGLCFVYKQDTNLVVLSSIAIISPKHDILDSEFCAYALKSDLIMSRIIGRKTGTAIRRIVLKALKTIKIPVPENMKEQQKIASILTQCDNTISNAQTNLTAMKALKVKLVNQFFSGDVI
jgi:type I restriction enzyme, S subunit